MTSWIEIHWWYYYYYIRYFRLICSVQYILSVKIPRFFTLEKQPNVFHNRQISSVFVPDNRQNLTFCTFACNCGQEDEQIFPFVTSVMCILTKCNNFNFVFSIININTVYTTTQLLNIETCLLFKNYNCQLAPVL